MRSDAFLEACRPASVIKHPVGLNPGQGFIDTLPGGEKALIKGDTLAVKVFLQGFDGRRADGELLCLAVLLFPEEDPVLHLPHF